jgi:hypothetical protein
MTVPIPAMPIGTVPRVGAFDRVRARPWVAVGVVAGVLLVAAWLGWAIYVGSDQGVTEGIGVLIAWPVLVLAVVLVCLPVVGIYFLIRYISGDSTAAKKAAPSDQADPPEPEEARATETG